MKRLDSGPAGDMKKPLADGTWTTNSVLPAVAEVENLGGQQMIRFQKLFQRGFRFLNYGWGYSFTGAG